MAERSKKTLVLGLYLAMAAEDVMRNTSVSVDRMTFRASEMLGDRHIQFATKGLLPSPRVTRWIVARALEWAAYEWERK